MFDLRIESDDYTRVNTMAATIIPRMGDTVVMTDNNGHSAEYLITGPARIAITELDDGTGDPQFSTETYVTVPGQLR